MNIINFKYLINNPNILKNYFKNTKILNRIIKLNFWKALNQ